MASGPLVPVPLVHKQLTLREVQSLSEWQYAPGPFYIAQVERSLRSDIPLLMSHRQCVTWGYLDQQLPQSDQLIGFGVLQYASEYSDATDRKSYPYITLLSTKPGIKSKGYGSSIINHLVGEAKTWVSRANESEPLIYESLVLDVYAENEDAIKCYKNNGFRIVSDNPLLDPRENNAPYYVMTKELA